MCARFGGELYRSTKALSNTRFGSEVNGTAEKDFTLCLDKNYSGKFNSEDDGGEDAARMFREAMQDQNSTRTRNRTA